MSEQQAFKQSPNLKPACPPLPVSGCPASLFKAEKRKGPFNRSREGNDLGRERRACGAKRTAGGVSRPGLASGSCSWRSADSCAKGEGGQASVERCQPKPRQAAGVPVVTLVPFSMRGPRAWAGGPLSLPNQVSSREAGLHTTWSGQRLRLLQSQADIRLCHQRKELTKRGRRQPLRAMGSLFTGLGILWYRSREAERGLGHISSSERAAPSVSPASATPSGCPLPKTSKCASSGFVYW
nr:PREDICTED: uncharacterized protein LOC107080062 isoform X1 [Lepisosteus oculatus]